MTGCDDSRTSGAIQTINFHGDEIVTFEKDGHPFVAMRRVSDNLGLTWAGEHAKLKAQTEKFSCIDTYTPGADAKVYEMLSMPVAKLPLWLATINPDKIPDASKRAKIELYQAESAIALHDYWTKGLALNQARLATYEEAREAALNELRKLRADDKTLYRKVRDAIAATSYDYQWAKENEPHKLASLFARIQDTFHVAVCGKTSQQLVIENANGAKPLVGMVSFDGDPERITTRDVRTGKNFLEPNPFRRLQNLYEQLFLFAEQHILKGEDMSLALWEERLHTLLKANGYEAFKLYSAYRAPEADAVARREMKAYKLRQRLAAA